MMNAICEWFWSPSVWLPPGYTWDDVKPSETLQYPNYDHLWSYPFAFVGVFFILRYCLLNYFLLNPLVKHFRIKDKNINPPTSNPTLETIYRTHSYRPPLRVVDATCANTGMSRRQVERWLRQRATAERSSDAHKFKDCTWQALYYVFYTLFGFYVLYDKPWLWDIRHCWYGFPKQPLSDDIWWYYMISLSFYWASTITHFVHYKHKDSMQMFLHHLLSIGLIVFSWTINLVRVGTLVLLVHECTDIPMLFARMAGYMSMPKVKDVGFAIFIILWLFTRTGFYPFWIIRSTLFEAHVILEMWYPIYYIFNGMLLSMLMMHIMWTFYIIRIVIIKLKSGVLSDVRSSSELESDKDDTEKKSV